MPASPKVLKWRSNRPHRRCIFCDWCAHGGGIDFSHYFCSAKNRTMSDETVSGIPRIFCALYEEKKPKEG